MINQGIEQIGNGKGQYYCLTHKGLVGKYGRDRSHNLCDLHSQADSHVIKSRIKLCKKRIGEILKYNVREIGGEVEDFECKLDELKERYEKLKPKKDIHQAYLIEDELKSLLKHIEESNSYIEFLRKMAHRIELVDEFGGVSLDKLIDSKVAETLKAKCELVYDQASRQYIPVIEQLEDKLRVMQSQMEDSDKLVMELLQSTRQNLQVIDHYENQFLTPIIFKHDLNKLGSKTGFAKIDELTNLELDTQDVNHANFMRKMINKKLPSLNAIMIKGMANEAELRNNHDDEIRQVGNKVDLMLLKLFIDRSLPLKFNNFGMNLSEGNRNVEDYMQKLIQISKQVQNMLFLSNCDLNSHQINQIMNAFSHVHTLVFESGGLDTDNLNFDGVKKGKIKTISFQLISTSYCNNWAEKPEKFEKIVKSISNGEMKNSVTQIYVYKSGITINTSQRIINGIGLQHIEARNNCINWKNTD